VEEDREILADRTIALGQQGFRGGADDHPVPVLHRQAEEFVANGATDTVNLHERWSWKAANRQRLLALPR
jgi:hypothetical protein